jgi:molybdopterin-guanine dinucleotide biosynthesis protein A
MGQTKALVEVDGTPMARRVADALEGGGCERVVVVGGRARELASLALPIVPDDHPGEGPLGGVLTALRLLPVPLPDHQPDYSADAGSAVFVAPCDLPDLAPAAVRAMIECAGLDGSADVFVARGARLEPALAIWRSAASDRVRAAFDGGDRTLHRAMMLLDVVEVTVHEAMLRNVNTPRDLAP